MDEASSGGGGCRLAGCGMGCVGLFFGGPILLLLLAYGILMHTAIPLRYFLDNADTSSGGQSVKFDGVSGSLASGVSIDEIIVSGEPGTTIKGLRVRYNGIWDAVQNKRLVIEELSIASADIVVENDFFSKGDSEDQEEPATSAEDVEEEAFLFELQTLKFETIRLRTQDGEFDVEIPLIRLEGLKVDGDDFALAALEVISDNLTLALSDATAEEVAGQMMPFTRKVTGTVSPGFHPRIKTDIDFVVKLAANSGAPLNQVTLCGGAYQQTMLSVGGSLVEMDALTLGDYVEAEDAILPERLTLTAREVDKVVSLESGEFFLGLTRFAVAEQEIDSEDKNAAIRAHAELGDLAVTAHLRPSREDIWPPLELEFQTDTKLEQPELLAQLYFQRAYDELSPIEKAQIDSRISIAPEEEPGEAQ